uniref:Transmembrane BAX inhibitor motif-containing protein 4 n=1 Tax=Coccolithus braarudii TaxID=221442 RepID=A0A7S0LL57_9EUKA|mmetsp:Transcript_46296/g.98742  ORF Transcript_46296/g.98742 Transcript_46296/m.98742 type:complete len:172 (+) Transcript_46296:2-517(+)
MLVTFIGSLVFLFAASAKKDSFPMNLYLLAGFTFCMSWSVGAVCALYYTRGLGILVLEALAITASVTVGLTIYTLRSKADFSYLGAGLGSALWVLILGGLVASFTAAPAMHLAMAVGGAVIFSLYIVYDVYLISCRLSPDDYIFAAISLYLDIANLFLNILRILGEMAGKD